MACYSFEEHKPGVAMVAVQIIYAFLALFAKSLFSSGISPMVFVVYRQTIATLLLVPTALLVRGPRKMTVGLRAFGLLFVASLIGCTLNQYFYYQGLNLTSPSVASALNNLIPVITFLMAASLGLEKLKLRSIRSMAKVVGTIVCVGGAIFTALFKGRKLLNAEFHTFTSALHSVSDQWMTGCLFLLASSCCGSLWLIFQVPICKRYLDPLSLSAWMCILSTFQSASLTYSLEPELQYWKITSVFELLCFLYAGIIGSGVTFYLQSWVISVRGPLYSALFSPVQTVIATVLAVLLLNEELHIGSLIGAIAVVAGLYIVLWGKAKDTSTNSKINTEEDSAKITITIDSKEKDGEDDMKEPLLVEQSNDIESQAKN